MTASLHCIASVLGHREVTLTQTPLCAAMRRFYNCVVQGLEALGSQFGWCAEYMAIWSNYHSIPQYHTCSSSMKAGKSINLCSIVVVLCRGGAEGPHSDTGLTCDKDTY